MRAHIGSLLIGALALSGCQSALPTTKNPTLTTSPAQAAPAANPAAPAIAKEAPAPLAPAPLEGVALSGQVRVDASALVASGSGVIASGGGNVIASGGGNYHVTAAATPALGTILPAQGMIVQAIDLSTGQPLGQPATTDASGHFSVSVPDSLKDNVLLLARVPGSTDTRLQYPLVVAPTQTDGLAIDEDSALVTRHMRRCLVKRFAALITAETVSANVDTFVTNLHLPAATAGLATPAFTDIQKKARAVGADKMTFAQREAIAERFTDALWAKIKLADLQIEPSLFGGKGQAEPAVKAMVEVMVAGREAALAKLTAEPDFFAKQDYIKTATRQAWAIKTPADLGDFIVVELMGDVGMDSFVKMAQVYASVGLPEAQSHRAERAAMTMAMAIAKVLIFDTASRQKALEAFDRP